MNNLAAHRALRSLSHPATLIAVLVLLINDHVLQALWPSWWTGKLSDVAWMVFAPPAAALLIAWIVPPRLRRQEDIVLTLAMALTALPFAAMKTIPAVHAAALRGLDLLMGGPRLVVFDPTDVVALVGLIGAWWVWRRSGEQPRPLPARGWMVLALAALGTVATTAAPSSIGITCLVVDENGTITVSTDDYRSFYESTDGGLTWEPAHLTYSRNFSGCRERYSEVREIDDPQNEQVVYRISPGEGVERSEDGGRTWNHEIDLSISEVQRLYYVRQPNWSVFGGPFDMVIHEPTGNIVIAMGYEGVVVRTQETGWQWVAVGPYRRVDELEPRVILSVLSMELALAGLLIPLTPAVLYFIAGPTTRGSAIPLLVSIFWALTALPPWGLDVFGFYGSLFLKSWIPILLLIELWVGKTTLDYLGGVGDPFSRISLAAFVAAGLFLLPFFIWLTGAISYGLAKAFALLLVAAVLGGVGWTLRRNRRAARYRLASAGGIAAHE